MHSTPSLISRTAANAFCSLSTLCSFDNQPYLDDGGAIETDDDGNIYRVNDWADVINELSEGGMVFITDTSKEILGARMNAAGEHIGDVSVVVDTYTRTVIGHGKTLPLSDDDCNAINDFLNDVYA